MKHISILILFLTLSFTGFSQITFEKGYFIDNQGKKVDCLIKNNDWLNNPTQFRYKLTEGTEEQTASIETVKEFGISTTHKYQRFKVNMDRSSDNIEKLTIEKKPVFQEETLFLKTLIEGEANLYLYNEKSLIRFFYKINDEPIQQLVYKRYFPSPGILRKNMTFHQQLLGYLNCHNASVEDVKRILYVKSDLVRHFKKHNECTGATVTDYGKSMNANPLTLRIRPGLKYASMSVHNELSFYDGTKLQSKPTFRLGLEGELILPFNNNKWSVILEPTIQYFKSTVELEGSVLPFYPAQSMSTSYTSLELPIGIRHYFYLNEDSKIFLNGLFAFDISNKSNLEFERSRENRRERSPVVSHNVAAGLGYDLKSKYNIELRYQFNRNTLRDYFYVNSKYNSISLVFGYKIK